MTNNSMRAEAMKIVSRARILNDGTYLDLGPWQIPQPGPVLALLREQAPGLEELKLAGVGMTELPDAIGNLTELRYLYLYGNILKALPNAIGRLTALVMLHLSRNKLTHLPEVIGNLESLDRLDADNNCLEELPESLGQLQNLRRLTLNQNALRTLPENIGALAALEYLNLANNPLTTLPESIGQLEKLTVLILSGNFLRSLPDSIVSLKSLVTLDVGNNRLVALPEMLGTRGEFDELNLQGNPLRALPEGLIVDSLDISDCIALTKLPDSLVVRGNLELGGTSLQPNEAQIERITWHGIAISPRIAFEPESITYHEVMRETNAERRRVMLTRMGYEKFVAEAKARTLDMDYDPGGTRRLLSINIPEDEPLVCLSVKCPSTGREYVLRVPPSMRTCHQAAAWIAGFDNPALYKPLVET